MDKVVTLKPFKDEDLAIMRHWLIEPHVYKWYHDPSAWIDEIEKRKTIFSFIKHFMVYVDGVEVGFCQYYVYAKGGEKWHGNIPLKGTYSIDYMIGDKRYLSKGYGVALIKALTERIFKETKALRIIVQPEEENLKSRKALINAGYRYDFDNKVFIASRNN